MTEEIIAERINSNNRLNNLKKIKPRKLLEIFQNYSEEEFNKLSNPKILIIVSNYINSECDKRGISKYATGSYDFYRIRGYDDDEISEIIKKRYAETKNSPFQIETYLKKGFSLKEAETQIRKYRPVHQEYWIERGYSPEESIEKVKEHQRSSSQKRQDDAKMHPEKYEGILPNQKEYWLKQGYSKKEAIEKVRERQSTFTLDKCIAKYGEKRGIEIWNERQSKWQKTLHKNFHKFGDGRSSQSKWASDMIDEICKTLDIQKYKKEKYITNRYTKKSYSYDFCYEKKIIEFNGDYWHCNPKFWKPDMFNDTLKMKAEEKWKFDEEKRKTAELYKYKVLTIWENEYLENKELCLEKCIKFLKNEN